MILSSWPRRTGMRMMSGRQGHGMRACAVRLHRGELVCQHERERYRQTETNIERERERENKRARDKERKIESRVTKKAVRTC